VTLNVGRPDPLGATVTADGVNFAVFAGHADRVELCIFEAGVERRLDLVACSQGTWYGLLAGATAGLVYGYRVHGPWDPSAGLRHNPNKLLLDPYARQVIGELEWHDALFGHVRGIPGGEFIADPRDSAPFVPKAVVCDLPAWTTAPPRVPWRDTVIYEAHVKGLTATHPEVPPSLRGTYAGVGSAPVIEHLQGLGVTALELLPVHLSVSEERLVRQGLSNYWGYGSLGFFAPDPRFATRADRAHVEFREMVQSLHSAGIEVLLDVVYNHTIEGPADGPTLSFRGLDNKAYYRLDPREPGRQVDWTGCGNTLDLRHPAVLRLVLDSLRWWVTEMGVDGFRFDLAPALLREEQDVVPGGRFSAALAQDPVLSRVKLIAEPWDLGPSGYSLGRFPAGWAEWNDQFRDTARHFWRGDRGRIPDLASRMAGSADLFASRSIDRRRQRGPLASINYVACHDGFTLADLTRWTTKRNEANGEANRDGTNTNISCNWGVEGPTDEPAVVLSRRRAQRNLIATTVFAQGVPMIGHGDELGRTQGGNNNAYCQDSEVSWVDWEAADRELLAFVSHALALRAGNAVFRRPLHFSPHRDDVTWLRLDGHTMNGSDWDRGDDGGTCFGMLLAADGVDDVDARLALLLFNGSGRDERFALGSAGPAQAWRCRLDTARPQLSDEAVGADLLLTAYSLQLLEVW
jgi:isoamylase